MSDTTLSIRDHLEDAVEQVESNVPESTVEETSPATEASAPADTPLSTDPAPEVSEKPGEEDKPLQADRQRDDNGKFAKKPEDGIQAGPKSEPKPAREERAPQSWKPETREHWKALPAEVRSEIARREGEFTRLMQETAESRRFADAVTKTLAPYEHFIKAENSNPIQAIDNLMATAARLRTGTAPELAGLVSGLIQQFGVGRFGAGFIETLDQALVGQTPKEDPREVAMRRQLEQEIAPVRQFMNEIQQRQQYEEQQRQSMAGSEVQGFLANHEFAMDVREDMADLIELAHKRGREMSLEEAYDRATRAHPEISRVLAQRDKAAAASSRNQVAQRARAASVSVGGAPVSAPAADVGKDLRSAVENAFGQGGR